MREIGRCAGRARYRFPTTGPCFGLARLRDEERGFWRKELRLRGVSAGIVMYEYSGVGPSMTTVVLNFGGKYYYNTLSIARKQQ